MIRENFQRAFETWQKYMVQRVFINIKVNFEGNLSQI